MSFWKLLSNNEQQSSNHSGLYDLLKSKLPDADENQLTKVACMAGLFTRIAQVDGHIDDSEREKMQESLKQWTQFSDQQIQVIVQTAASELKRLAGLEDHLYARPLNDLMDNDEKYEVLEALFGIAASDGTVDNQESESIRLICGYLNLSHQHFVSARATVVDYLKALK